MIILFHGENQLASRLDLSEKISFYRAKKAEIIKINGLKTNLTEVKQACESKSLFGEKRLIVVENFFNQLRSKQKNEIQSYFKNLTTEVDIIFWEKKAITSAQLRQIPANTKVLFFKVEPIIFKFLDSLFPGNLKRSLNLLKQCYQKDSPEMIFYMLCRQIRLLILARDLGKKGLTPMPFWMQNKFLSQSRRFSLDKLLGLHRHLLKIDFEQKTGRAIMSLSFHLDLLVASL